MHWSLYTEEANNNMDTALQTLLEKNENKKQYLEIMELLNNVEHSDEIDDLKIHHLVSEINILLKVRATFKTYKRAHEKKKIRKDNKPWFDSDCSE